MASTINISLPDDLMRYVEAIVSSGKCACATDYTIALIEADYARHQQGLSTAG